MTRQELLESRLERWARWRTDANRVPTGGYPNPLAGLVGEGKEVDRGSRSVKRSLDAMRQIRQSLTERIKAAGDDQDEIERLKRVRRKFPTTPTALPWASLIHGTGPRPDPDCPEEEETELAVAALMVSLQTVVHMEYRRDLPQEQKAKELGYARTTYRRRLEEAHREIMYRLGI